MHTNSYFIVFFSSSRWWRGFVLRCRTTWTLWGTRRQTPSWRMSGQQRTLSKMPGTLKRWRRAQSSYLGFMHLNSNVRWAISFRKYHVIIIADLFTWLCFPQLLPNLYHLGSASREDLNSSSVGPIQEKLESMAGEVTSVMDKQLQVKLYLYWI